MIRIRCGQFLLKSSLNDQEEDSLFQFDNGNERRFYAKYKLELSDLRIVYIERNIRFSLLRRISLIDIHFYKCKLSNDATLSK